MPAALPTDHHHRQQQQQHPPPSSSGSDGAAGRRQQWRRRAAGRRALGCAPICLQPAALPPHHADARCSRQRAAADCTAAAAARGSRAAAASGARAYQGAWRATHRRLSVSASHAQPHTTRICTSRVSVGSACISFMKAAPVPPPTPPRAMRAPRAGSGTTRSASEAAATRRWRSTRCWRPAARAWAATPRAHPAKGSWAGRCPTGALSSRGVMHQLQRPACVLSRGCVPAHALKHASHRAACRA